MADNSFEQVAASVRQNGQGHLLQWTESLSAEQKTKLFKQLSTMDMAKINTIFKETTEKHNKHEEEKISPFTGELTELALASDNDRSAWRELGMKLICEGKVAALLMGGGQGTRLGFDHPKGMYDIGLPSKKTIFQLQAEKLLRLRNLAAEATGKKTDSISLPWYVMTSHATHAETAGFFEQNNHFGIPVKEMYFFQQAQMPCFFNDGKIVLDAKDQVATSPNGNGGIYDALVTHGILEDMKKRGVEYVHVYGVDNVLVKVCDPVFIGFMHAKKSDCASKVVLKRDPKESVGVLASRNGKFSVVEYSELSKDMSEAKDDKSGKLLYGAGSIANHCFSIGFLEQAAKTQLPYHVANKKIPFVDDKGQSVKPDKNNGIKLETFIFDAFALSLNPVALAVQREEEFSPVKNKSAQGAVDSPATACVDFSQYCMRLIVQAGGTVEVQKDGDNRCEVSALVSYDGEGLDKIVKGKSYALPLNLSP